jgi:hypothetical protein
MKMAKRAGISGLELLFLSFKRKEKRKFFLTFSC